VNNFALSLKISSCVQETIFLQYSISVNLLKSNFFKIEDKMLAREYHRWEFIQNVLRKLSPSYYDLYNNPPGILEIWLIGMLTEHGVEIFEGELDYKYLQTQLKYVGKERLFPEYKSVIDFMMLNYKNTMRPEMEPEMIIGTEYYTFRYGMVEKKVETPRAELFMKCGDVRQIMQMILRYAFISVRGSQQWSVPEIVYRNAAKYYDITTEGFGSPLNSRMMMITDGAPNSFCSLFPDVDTIFGSCGNFFAQKWAGRRVFINPPFIGFLILDVLQILETALKSDARGLFIVVFPEWEHEECYRAFKNSKYLKYMHIFEKKHHHYVSGLEKIMPSFKTAMFLLTRENVENKLQHMFD